MKKRLALYVFFDRDGIADDYVVYQLKELHKVCDTIVVICQGEVGEESRAVLEGLVEQVIYRENKGYDAGAWKDAMFKLGWEKLAEYDDLVLMNDSCFGPVYPFSEMFEEMDSRDLDFWGITAGEKQKDPYKMSPYGYFPEHIQSYFLCFKHQLHTSQCFKDYWLNLIDTDSFEKSVTFFETMITKCFEDAGFKWEVYCDIGDYRGSSKSSLNPTAFLMDKMLIEQRNPLIKKKSMMRQLPVQLTKTEANLARRSLDYIREKTDYDEDLILKTILRLGTIRTLYELYHWDYFLPSQYLIGESAEKKLALVLVINEENKLEYCRAYADSVPEEADIYILSTEAGIEKARAAFNGSSFRSISYRAIANCLNTIDILEAVKNDIPGYELVCLIGDGISFKRTEKLAEEGLRDNKFNALLETPEYVRNLLGLFDKNPRLGIIAPPYPMSGKYTKLFGEAWLDGYSDAYEMAKLLGIETNMYDSKSPIILEPSLWFRPEALKDILSEDLTAPEIKKYNSDVNTLSKLFEYAAQKAGFYTAAAMSVEKAQLAYSVNTYQLRRYLFKFNNAEKKVKSNSYRIGRAITALPRYIKRKIK